MGKNTEITVKITKPNSGYVLEVVENHSNFFFEDKKTMMAFINKELMENYNIHFLIQKGLGLGFKKMHP